MREVKCFNCGTVNQYDIGVFSVTCQTCKVPNRVFYEAPKNAIPVEKVPLSVYKSDFNSNANNNVKSAIPKYIIAAVGVLSAVGALIYFYKLSSVPKYTVNAYWDSVNATAFLKDSLDKVEKKRALDSFNKTPEGIAVLQKLKKDTIERRKAEYLDSIKREKAYALESKKNAKKQEKLDKIIKKLGCTQYQAEAVLNKEIYIGMTIEMVIYERGNADHVNTSNYGNGDQFQCCWMDWSPSCFYCKSDHIVYAYN